MNRREFIYCLGKCAYILALAGCAVPKARQKELIMSENTSHGESIENKDWDISVCGLNCALCKKPEQGECGGCRGHLDQCWSENCGLKSCAKAKGLQYCFQCDEFLCDKLIARKTDGCEHHRLAVENMKKMREIGLENWIAEQPKPMFCPGWLF